MLKFYKFLRLDVFMLALSVVALTFFSRMIFFNMPLRGEEGTNFFHLNNWPRNGETLWIATFEGKDVLIAPEHPITLYYGMYLIIRLCRHLETLGVPIEFALRTVPTFFLAGLFLLIATLIKEKKTRNWCLVLTFIISCSPAVYSSLQSIQTDTTFGFPVFLLAGLLYINYIRSAKIGKQSVASFSIFASGLLIGIGKQEWAFASLFAVFLTIIVCRFHVLPGEIEPGRERLYDLGSLVIFGFSILLGTFVAFSLDPRNYLASFDVIRRTVITPNLQGDFDITRFLSLVIFRSPTLLLFLTVTVFYFFILRTHRKIGSPTLVLPIFLILLNTLPSAISTWNSDLRYMAPAGALVTLVPLLLASIFDFSGVKLSIKVSKIGRMLLAGTLIVSLAQNALLVRDQVSINESATIRKNLVNQGKEIQESCIYIFDSGTAYYFRISKDAKSFKWISDQVGSDYVDSLIQKNEIKSSKKCSFEDLER